MSAEPFTTEQIRGFLDERFIEGGPLFDRWLAEHDAQVAAKALRNAATDLPDAMTRQADTPAADDEGGRRALPEGAHAATWPGGGCQCFCAIGHDHDADDEGGQE